MSGRAIGLWARRACAPAVLVAILALGGENSAGAEGAGSPWRLVYATEVAGRRGLDVYVVDVPAGRPRRVAGVPGRDDFSPSSSPDGRTIAYRLNPVRGDEGEIMIVASGGGKPRNLTKSPRVADWSPVWHPSGKTIAFFSSPNGRGDLWLMRRDGTLERRLTRDGTLNEYPTFSPDGTRIAFQSHRAGGFDIYVLGKDRRERSLTRHPARDQWAAWSPDGKWIAFMSERDGAEDVFVMRPDGSGVRNLTRTASLYESHPTWAPDGRLTFSRHGESGPISLWVIEPDGTGAKRLDTVAQPVFTFDWLER